MQVTVTVFISTELYVTVTVVGGGQYCLEHETRTRIGGSPNVGLVQRRELTYCVYSPLMMMVV